MEIEDSKKLELNSRKELLKSIAEKCNEDINNFSFKTLDKETLDTINLRLLNSCSIFDDIYTKFYFIPLTKEEIESGKADFISHLKVTYHSIDTAETEEKVDANTWLSQL